MNVPLEQAMRDPLGLIFLRYAGHKFAHAAEELEGQSTRRRKVGKADYQARGVLYLPDEARFSALEDVRFPQGGCSKSSAAAGGQQYVPIEVW